MNKIPEGHIATYTGRIINPLDPDPEQIDILDICHHLSNICRFTGAVKSFYSVGEHSCRVSDILEGPEKKLYGVLHDASEAYIADLARPIKRTKEMEFYRIIEKKLMDVIYIKFGLDINEPEEVKEADNIMLITEQRDLMPPETFCLNGYKPLKTRIKTWTSTQAYFNIIYRFEKLGIKATR